MNVDQLILDIWGGGGGEKECVCGISSWWSLKIVSPAEIWKLSKAQKVAMVCACCLYTFHICVTITITTESNVLPTTQDNISVIEQTFFLLFWMVPLAPSPRWINTLSCLPLILSTKASQRAMASLWNSVAAWRSHTSFIFLKLVNAVSTNIPLPFRTSMLLEKSTQGRQYPPLSCHL